MDATAIETGGRLERPGEAPAEPRDYGFLNAVWAAAMAGVILAARGRAERGDPVPRGEIVPLGMATFSLAKVIAREKAGTWVREPFVEQSADHRPVRPRGRRLQRAVGELVTCTRCVGAWCALALVGLRIGHPPSGRIVTAVLATSAVSDFLQAGFRLATEAANTAGGPADPGAAERA